LNLEREDMQQFNSVITQVRQTFNTVRASGASVYIIYKNKVVAENYWGKHSEDDYARNIQEDTQFHVASVRKSYIGYAVAYAVYSGAIDSIDDEVTNYLPHLDKIFFKGITIRHLLTHTHGLNLKDGQVIKEFKQGEDWAYRNIGVDMLTQIVYKATGNTIAEIMKKQVFQPLGFKESGWYTQPLVNHVEVIREPDDRNWVTSDSLAGDKMNMYVSARELAFWGYFHLKKGIINDKQIVPKEIITLATSIQTPSALNIENPQNGFFWFVKGQPSKRTEIGELVPENSYQILGYTGVTLLVIPQHDLVAVRMFNSFGSPDGFDYLADVRSFGDTIMKCL
jgi:CubicO group peptidase (beta-lactamase class C family)